MKFRLWLALIAIASIASPAFAQVDNGRIAGIVRDSSGAMAPGVTAKVKNERTGEERSATTNDQGYFLITPLKPSTYTIKVERAGFAPIEYTSMPLAIGQELTLDFELKPAGVTEAVTVVGSSPVLDLSSAKIGVNLGEREVNNLPVNGRQMSQLMLQAPRLAERGHRHLAGHPLLRTGGRTERDPVRRYRRLRDHRRGTGQPQRGSRDTVQAASEPGERAGVPCRVERVSR